MLFQAEGSWEMEFGGWDAGTGIVGADVGHLNLEGGIKKKMKTKTLENVLKGGFMLPTHSALCFFFWS